MAEYTKAGILKPISHELNRRSDPDRKAVVMQVYTNTDDGQPPPDLIHYPRQYPLEISWTKGNPK